LADSLSGVSYSAALEHSYSSVYYSPQARADKVSDEITGLSCHEFFHIVTPLNIHSEEISNFNFDTPKMSKHLWLYEGLTEYA
jgi:predicted metalloprotease with PDZ domain